MMNTEMNAVALIDAPGEPPVSIQYWANEINAATEDENEAIHHKGRVLIAARKALLRYGLWEKLFKKNKRDAVAPVRFSVKTALMYIKIAQHPILSNSNLNYCLPPNWTVQYQLTFVVPDSLLIDYIAAGLITPELSKDDAVKLRTAKSPDGIVVRSDGSLGLVGEDIPNRQYATLAALEVLFHPTFNTQYGQKFSLCGGRHVLVIASIMDPPQPWKAFLDGEVGFLPWPDILVADFFGPHDTPMVLVQPDVMIANTILSLYRHRYGDDAVVQLP